jgi:hypothetical protein
LMEERLGFDAMIDSNEFEGTLRTRDVRSLQRSMVEN